MNAATGPSGPFATYRAGMILLGCYVVLLTKVAPMPGALWTMLAVFAASFVSSVVGFGFAALCGVLLVHLLGDPVSALEITLVCGLASQAMMAWSLRRDIDWHACPNFLLGAAFGLPIGFYVLLHQSSRFAAQALGVLLVFYAVLAILRRPMVVDGRHGIGDAVAGFLGGITGGVAAFPAAPIVVWCDPSAASTNPSC